MSEHITLIVCKEPNYSASPPTQLQYKIFLNDGSYYQDSAGHTAGQAETFALKKHRFFMSFFCFV